MRDISILLGARFAVFEVDEEMDECFREGEVCGATDTHVDVDFGDVILRFPRSSVRETHYFYMRLLISPENPGVMIRDYRLIALAA
jgi:hypothetical protein